MSAAAAQKTDRLVGLDGLRGILLLCVITVHVMGALNPVVLSTVRFDIFGQAIVVFFVMSGFLIYWPFAAALLRDRPQPSLKVYVTSRLLRVYPGYLAIFLLSAVLLSAVYVTNATLSLEHYSDAGTGGIHDPLRVLLHMTVLQNYLPSELQTGLNPSWTLTVELTFYALLPLLAAGAAWLVARRGVGRLTAALLPAIALLAIGIVARVVGLVIEKASGMGILEAEWGDNPLGVFSRSLLVWSDNFGLGMIAVVLFLAVKSGADIRIGRLPLRLLCVVVGLAGLALTAVCMATAPRFISAAFGLFSAALVLFLLLPTHAGGVSRLARAFDVQPLHYLGVISLSAYLWHYPVLIVVTRLGWFAGETPLGAAQNVVVVALLTVAAASATYWAVERPAQAWASRIRREDRARRRPAAAAPVAAQRPAAESPAAERPAAEPAAASVRDGDPASTS
ncbi:acyltransferase family protein [Microbacterium sp. NPDC055683]